jgi:UDP:flavonoid glycosyltransferase YjiC (YdhE family)
MAARRRGHDVVFATGADLVPHIQARGLSAGAIRAEIEAMPDADAVLSALTESDVASARRGSRPRRLASSS